MQYFAALSWSVQILIVSFVFLLIAGMIFLSAKGKFEIRAKGVQLGQVYKNPSKESKVLVLHLVRFVDDYIDQLPPKVTKLIRENAGFDPHPKDVFLVTQCAHERMLTWVLLNHIVSTEKYHDRKVKELCMAMSKVMAQVSPTLAVDPVFEENSRRFAETVVTDFVNTVIQYKVEYGQLGE